MISCKVDAFSSLHWRHNGRDGVSNHRRLGCLLNRLFGRRSKKTSKLRVNGLCEGKSPVTGEFTAQRAGNAEKVSIWWRHHFWFQFKCCGWNGVEDYANITYDGAIGIVRTPKPRSQSVYSHIKILRNKSYLLKHQWLCYFIVCLTGLNLDHLDFGRARVMLFLIRMFISSSSTRLKL